MPVRLAECVNYTGRLSSGTKKPITRATIGNKNDCLPNKQTDKQPDNFSHYRATTSSRARQPLFLFSLSLSVSLTRARSLSTSLSAAASFISTPTQTLSGLSGNPSEIEMRTKQMLKLFAMLVNYTQDCLQTRDCSYNAQRSGKKTLSTKQTDKQAASFHDSNYFTKDPTTEY